MNMLIFIKQYVCRYRHICTCIIYIKTSSHSVLTEMMLELCEAVLHYMWKQSRYGREYRIEVEGKIKNKVRFAKERKKGMEGWFLNITLRLNLK